MLVTDLFDVKKRITSAQRVYLGAMADLRNHGLSFGQAQHNSVADLVAAATPSHLDAVAALPWITGLRTASSLQPGLIEQCRAASSGGLAGMSWQGALTHPHLVEPLTRLVMSGARIAIATRDIALSCLLTASMVTRTSTEDLAALLDDDVDEASIVMALRVDPLLVTIRLNSVATALANVGGGAPLTLAAAGVHRTTSSVRRAAA